MDAAISLESAWLATALLLSLRLAGTFVATPILAPASVPLPVRALLIVGFSITLSLGLPRTAAPAGLGDLVAACLTELALGATLGLGILLAFAAVSGAGQLVGIEIGFGLGQAIDPSSNASMPTVAAAFQQLAVLVLFLLNGHHALLRGLAYSLERFPLGRPWPLDAAFGPIVVQVSGLLTLGFALAAPVVFCLLLVEMALGVMARNLPQMNMLAVGIPIKIVAGLVALALWANGMGDVLSRVYASIHHTWEGVFSAQVVDRPERLALQVPPAAAGAPAQGRAG